jgi:hypothetical protein
LTGDFYQVTEARVSAWMCRPGKALPGSCTTATLTPRARTRATSSTVQCKASTEAGHSH